MSRIFWDTNLFVYLLEGRGPLSKRVASFRRAMISRGDQLITSALTLGEVLVKPIEKGDAVLAGKYEQALIATAAVIDFDARAAKVYAELRCDHSLRAPDAIQLACASVAGVDLFVTNDARLQSKQVRGVQFIVPLDRAPL